MSNPEPNSEPVERESVTTWLIVIAVTIVLLIIGSARVYDVGYTHGQQFERERAVDAGVAIDDSERGFYYLKRHQLRAGW